MRDKINISDWLTQEKSKVQSGIELELLLFDARNKEPLNNMNLLEKILSNLPAQIYRDHYPYQLEIRTKPNTDASSIVEETRKLYRMASAEFLKHKIYVIPAPAISQGFVYCGLHIHLSYPNMKDKKEYYNKAMGMYPFLLSLADHTKNFEINQLQTSERIDKSRHIGLPRLDSKSFLRAENFGPGDNHKYNDIIFSPAIEDNNNRSRMRKPDTIEVRLLDTPSLFKFYDFIIHFIINLANRIKTDNLAIKQLNENHAEYTNKISMTRMLMTSQRYGVNKIFRMLNADVCEYLADEFNLKFPRETQFEYRENLGLSADVNGYLSMATKGGWL